MVYGVLFKVGFLYENFTGCVQHGACCVEAQFLDSSYDPLINFVGKLVEIDVILKIALLYFALYVDGVLGEHAGELDVQTVLTDCE